MSDETPVMLTLEEIQDVLSLMMFAEVHSCTVPSELAEKFVEAEKKLEE